MVTHPHHTKDVVSMGSQNSNKRKRDNDGYSAIPPPTRLQTTGLDTPRTQRISDISIDDGLSPRTAVSARFSNLNLRSSISTSPTRRTKRRASWTMHEDAETKPEMKDSSQQSSNSTLEIGETPEPTVSIPESRSESESDKAKVETKRVVFEFKAGKPSTPSPVSEHDRSTSPSPSKPGRLSSVEDPCTPSPSKRRRRESTSPSPQQTPIPRSLSPSASKLPSHRRHASQSSTNTINSTPTSSDSDPDPDLDAGSLWWQDSEITGHDPTDPDEDNRGVNGIGYQKSKAEAWKVAERRKKQIAEWRSREAKEARALRAGGRRTLMGRVTKSRSGSPVEQRGERDRVRMSPGFKGRLEGELAMTEIKSPKKGVRFEEG